MKELVLEGDPELLGRFDRELWEEFEGSGVADLVTLETKTVRAEVAPGEMGFGEEVKKILIGIADVLEAGKEATTLVSEGIAKRLARNSIRMEIRPDGTILLAEDTSGESNAVELAKQIAAILQAR
jgi:hypothetical protein